MERGLADGNWNLTPFLLLDAVGGDQRRQWRRRTARPSSVNTPQPNTEQTLGKPLSGWRLRLYTIIFEADTRAGQLFDRWLIALILASVAVVVLDSVPAVGTRYATVLGVLEWGFTLLFTAEYIARLLCVRHPLRYARSFFGVVDLLSVLPTYLALLLPGTHVLVDVRVLRLLRIFRVFSRP